MDAQQITLILVALVTSTGTYLATKSTNKVSLQNENVKNAKALYDHYRSNLIVVQIVDASLLKQFRLQHRKQRLQLSIR